MLREHLGDVSGSFRERFGERAETEIRRIVQIVSNERPAHVTFTIEFEDAVS